jgi:enoyl-CoA hydratase/carnithine racemase
MKVEYRVTKGIGRLEFSNPPKNALERPAFMEARQLEQILGEPELKGLILTGGGRHFSVGADQQELATLRGDEARLASELAGGRELLSRLTFAPVPVVAMIRGSCLGGGLEIALAAHFRVASKNAILGFPESTLGLMPGLGGALLSSEVVSRAVAMELMISGRMIGADEALELGLVDRVVSTKALEAEAAAFLDRLVGRRSPRVVRAIVESINNARRLDRATALKEEGRLFLEVARAISHADGAEGERR